MNDNEYDKYKSGVVGKETYFFTDIYENINTGERIVVDNLHKNSPRPDPNVWKPVAPQTKGVDRKPSTGKGRKTKRRRSTKKLALKRRKVR